MTRTGLATEATSALVRKIPFTQHVPVAADESLAAAMTIGATTYLVMDIPGVGMANAVAQGDLTSPSQGLGGCGPMIEHLPVGMEGGEVDGNIRSELGSHPLGSARRAPLRSRSRQESAES